MNSLIRFIGADDDAYINIVTLIRAIARSRRGYIIPGHSPGPFSLHTKPHSLDYGLRERLRARRDTPLADKQVIRGQVESGYFVPDNRLPCPDSGGLCRGLRLAQAGLALIRERSMASVRQGLQASE